MPELLDSINLESNWSTVRGAARIMIGPKLDSLPGSINEIVDTDYNAILNYTTHDPERQSS